MAQLPAEFKAALETYQGPLDLLLYLIRKEEVDIFDIPIGRITEQFLQHLTILQSIDPNACGEFLVMAANLMEIKSRSLLPTEAALDGEEMLEDPRIELVRQLLEYKKYKERALLLSRRIDEFSRRFRRPEARLPDLPPGTELEEPMDLGSVSVWDLLSAFHRIQLSLGEKGPHRVVFEDRPIEDYIKVIRERALLSCGRPLHFDEFFQDCRDIYDAIGYFLAILEMAKRHQVRFRQEVAFGPIEIELRTDAEEPPQAAAAPAGEAPVASPAPEEAPPALEAIPPGDDPGDAPGQAGATGASGAVRRRRHGRGTGPDPALRPPQGPGPSLN